MKYIYEPITSSSILRRVDEHERETGKRVVEVRLTRPEWLEFLSYFQVYEHTTSSTVTQFTLRKRAPISFTPSWGGIYDAHEYTLTVRPE